MNTSNELQALENALTSLNLTGYKVHQWCSAKGKYFLTDPQGYSLTGYWDYVRLNHFIMGYGKALNKCSSLEKRFRLLYTILNTLNNETDCNYNPFMEKLEILAGHIDAGSPQALEALTYYEDNVLAILTSGQTVIESN